MRSMKTRLIFLLILVIVLAAGCTVSNNDPNGSDGSESQENYTIPIYYTDTEHTSLILRNAQVVFSSASSAKQRLDELIAFMQNPESLFPGEAETLHSVIPEGIFIKAVLEASDAPENTKGSGNVLRIEMEKQYADLSNTEQLIFRTGFSQTVFSASDISRIDLYVRNNDSFFVYDQILSSDRMIIDQYDEGFYRDELKVTLYFAGKGTNYLEPEERVLRLGMTESLAMGIVKALIEGPVSEDLVKTLPEGSKVNDIVIEDGVCYIDLNDKFQLNHSGGETAEKLTIYSLVNSLGRINGINYVQILIEGKKVEYYKSYVPIDSFLQPDLSLIGTKE